jgi:hypothetical protein
MYTQYRVALQRGPISYPEWLFVAVQSGELRGDNLQATVDSFFANQPH